jgi:hypothetical protein
MSKLSQRYNMMKRVISTNRLTNLGRNDRMVMYMELFNRAKTQEDIDNALDAIILHDKNYIKEKND